MSSLKRVKSRGGCATCKKRKVKCDETHPSCRQCLSKGQFCPGYSQRLKWNPKYEKYGPAALTATDRIRKRPGPKPRVRPYSQRQTNLHLITTRPENSREDLKIDHCHDSALPQLKNPIQDTCTNIRTILSDCDQLACSYSSICGRLTIYDSNNNHFRSVVTSPNNRSALSSTTLRYVTCSYLVQRSYTEGQLSLLYQARAQMLQCLQTELTMCTISHKDFDAQVLLAIILYGIATAWGGSENLGVEHYNAAVTIFNRLIVSGFEESLSGQVDFFRGTLIYWWMGLCFSPEVDKLYAPPDCLDQIESQPGLQISNVMAHCVTGISSRILVLLGEVAALVVSQRQQLRRQREARHVKSSDGKVAPSDANISKAEQLEALLLAAKWPPRSMLTETCDPETPVSDLVATAEVYRSTALILLYRTFPHILDRRLTSITEDNRDCSCLLEDKRDKWLQSLAIKSLSMLESNSQKSGTRGYEQVPLVIIAGEMRLESQIPCRLHPSDTTAEAWLEASFSPNELVVDDDLFWGCKQSLVAGAMLVDRSEIIESSETNSDFEYTNCQSNLRDVGQSLSGNSDRRWRILRARMRISQRMQTIYNRLPVDSVGRIQEFVVKLWKDMDNNRNIFWVDLILENGWILNML